MQKKSLIFIVLVLLSLGMAPTATAKPIEVVASFTILADVVKNVGGERVNVRSLVPPNGDPHDYEPSPDNVKAVKAASVAFLSGEGLETWFRRLAKASGNPREPILVSSGIATRSMVEDGETINDPHVWNSVANVLVWVDNIEAALIDVAPADAGEIQASANSYREKLRALEVSIRADIAQLPAERRKVLTSHDAFGYYAQAYGIRFLSPLGVSTETEASAADVAKLIDQIRHEGVLVYFIENSNNGRLVKQIAKATGAVPGGALYPEALSEEGGPASTYIELMQYNTHQIVQAILARGR